MKAVFSCKSNTVSYIVNLKLSSIKLKTFNSVSKILSVKTSRKYCLEIIKRD